MPALYNFMSAVAIWIGNSAPITFRLKKANGSAFDCAGTATVIHSWE